MLFGNVFRFKLHQVMFQLLPGDKIQVDAYFSDGLEPRSLDYAPEKKKRLEPKQHPIEKENHLPSTSILGLKFVHVPGLV